MNTADSLQMARPRRLQQFEITRKRFETFCAGVEPPEVYVSLLPTRLAEVMGRSVFGGTELKRLA